MFWSIIVAMFTGIVRTVKKVKNVKKEGSSLFLNIEKPTSFKIKSGNSILTSGACLTVVKVSADSYITEIMKATLDKTSFGILLPDWVNLEPSIKAGEPIDGHFVLGHVDTVGKIEKIERDNRTMSVAITHPKENSRLIIPRGSIAVDGVSLSVADCEPGRFLVNLVDFTIGGTIFRYAKEGNAVNIEYDMLGKYLIKNYG